MVHSVRACSAVCDVMMSCCAVLPIVMFLVRLKGYVYRGSEVSSKPVYCTCRSAFKGVARSSLQRRVMMSKLNFVFSIFGLIDGIMSLSCKPVNF
jgi:hypothetical protein